LLFKLTNLMADRAVGHAQLRRRPAKVSVAGSAFEGLKGGQWG